MTLYTDNSRHQTAGMNFEGAGGFKFGGGNVKVDLSVLKGKQQLRVSGNFGSERAKSLRSGLPQELPEGCTVTSTETHGVSIWASVGCIDVSLVDGTEQTFFIKVLSKDHGRDMVISECRVDEFTAQCRARVRTETDGMGDVHNPPGHPFLPLRVSRHDGRYARPSQVRSPSLGRPPEERLPKRQVRLPCHHLRRATCPKQLNGRTAGRHSSPRA